MFLLLGRALLAGAADPTCTCQCAFSFLCAQPTHALTPIFLAAPRRGFTVCLLSCVVAFFQNCFYLEDYFFLLLPQHQSKRSPQKTSMVSASMLGSVQRPQANNNPQDEPKQTITAVQRSQRVLGQSEH